MKVALIPPVPQIEMAKDGDIHMVLTHLVMRYPEYACFYAKETKYKVLDNGAYESEPQPIEEVVKAAKLVKADEIILPDVIFQGAATLKSTREAINWLSRAGLVGRYKLHAVPQGNTREEWWECLEALLKIPEVDVIGLSKLSTPVAFKKQLTKARLEITTELDKGLCNLKEFHLLGGSYDVLNEVKQHPAWVRSIDTSAPFEFARHQRFLFEAAFEIPKARLEEAISREGISELCMERNLKHLLEAAHANQSK